MLVFQRSLFALLLIIRIIRDYYEYRRRYKK